MAEKVFKMTAEGKAQLEAERDSLKTEGRIDIAEKLKVARSYGDLSENSEYDEAKSEQAKIEARINELEYQLEHAEIIGATEKGSVEHRLQGHRARASPTMCARPMRLWAFPSLTRQKARSLMKARWVVH